MANVGYIDRTFYVDEYLLGREPVLSETDFDYWEAQARFWVDFYTFGRIKKDANLLEEFKSDIGIALCELAEFLYNSEGSIDKQSESISGGRSTTYIKGIEYNICLKHLFMTGLMYRGSEGS